jgi:hypothetical protein
VLGGWPPVPAVTSSSGYLDLMHQATAQTAYHPEAGVRGEVTNTFVLQGGPVLVESPSGPIMMSPWSLI